ncbi:MAG TPA: XdhC family protein [Verrucomicrobiae bacterium]|jgi:xanthine/CO dehydrogenase XdhC/CoxF family maturation factor|nr:XdhC family protein [Verrucomicrobiae bacterium]
MKELADILAAWRARPDAVAALATVAQTEGSSYRRPGARMLILKSGETIGSISGGCLERDVADKAEGVRASGAPLLLTYDTGTEEDIVFGAGLGCKGVVRILLEPVRAELMRFLNNIFDNRAAGVVATIFRAEGGTARVGDRLTLADSGEMATSLAPGATQDWLACEAREALRRGRTKEARLEGGGATVEALVEAIQGPQPLVIFGAGYDAVPLTRMARELGCHVTVVDARPAYADAERFPAADAVIVARPEQLQEKITLTERTAVVVMSHHYLTDAAVFQALAPQKLRYLGLMGPRKRAEKMAAEHSLSLDGVHNPIGLDIGAETPEQIALAILAEIQAAAAGRPGGSLRERPGPIHRMGVK